MLRPYKKISMFKRIALARKEMRHFEVMIADGT